MIAKTLAATRGCGANLAKQLQAGSVLGLVGELGAGKTSFVQGVARGLGYADWRHVVSPTYTIVNEYVGGRLALVHIDLYRLDNMHAAIDLGLPEYMAHRNAVVAVEWANHLPSLLPPDTIWITLAFEAHHRRITLPILGG